VLRPDLQWVLLGCLQVGVLLLTYPFSRPHMWFSIYVLMQLSLCVCPFFVVE
jgi:hypothetical protein